jgi:RNA polymerase sigma-70 factor (ECF subfamily)
MGYDDEESERLLRRVLSERVKTLAFIRSIVRRRDLAEDVFQDLCVLVIQKRQELSGVGHLGGWLRTAARQLAWNAVRKRANRDLLLGDKVHALMEPHWSRLDSVSDSAMSEALEICLQFLRPKARDIIRSHYVEGLGCGDLAQRLGRPVDSLYVTMSRIHKMLAECILRRTGMKRMGNA